MLLFAQCLISRSQAYVENGPVGCLQVYVCSHFAQPNSIEYEPALKWRCLERVVGHAKEQLRLQHAAHLADLMQAYIKVWP